MTHTVCPGMYTDLERIARVLDEVDTDVEVGRRWQKKVRDEGSEAEDLEDPSGCRRRLANEHRVDETGRHDVTPVDVDVDVDGSVDRLVTQSTHRLQGKPPRLRYQLHFME